MTTWFNLAAIALAGAFGALSRYAITLAAAAIPNGSTLYGTTFANVLGCALLGGLTAIPADDSEAMQRIVLALRVGFLGSLTTFSTFAAESSLLASEGRWSHSAGYVLANLVLGWVALVAVGQWVKGWA